MQLKKAPYAALGTGQLAFEKCQEAYGKARRTGRDDLAKGFDSLTRRGERLVGRVQRSKPAKRAAEGTRQATRQLKGAATSIRKALGLEEQGRTTRKAS
jgi:hypothetical protein